MIPYGCKLTAQETWWRSTLGDRFEGVDNADARARLERGDKIIEQCVGLMTSPSEANLLVHYEDFELALSRGSNRVPSPSE